jgi:hypothetical protein
MAQALTPWRGGRVVYGSGLENQRVFTGTVGSNPTLSVLKINQHVNMRFPEGGYLSRPLWQR